jgi:hypothetical protein
VVVAAAVLHDAQVGDPVQEGELRLAGDEAQVARLHGRVDIDLAADVLPGAARAARDADDPLAIGVRLEPGGPEDALVDSEAGERGVPRRVRVQDRAELHPLAALEPRHPHLEGRAVRLAPDHVRHAAHVGEVDAAHVTEIGIRVDRARAAVGLAPVVVGDRRCRRDGQRRQSGRQCREEPHHARTSMSSPLPPLHGTRRTASAPALIAAGRAPADARAGRARRSRA